jgi:hypothetical protein
MLYTKKKIILPILLLTASVVNLYAQEMPIKAGKILELCYQFKLKSADSLINIYFSQSKAGEEVELNMLKANIYWWKIISGINDKSTKITYYQTLSKAEKYYNNESDKGYAHLYKGISLYGYMARMDGLNKNYLKAFFRVNNCLKYLEKSFGAEAKYPFFYLSSGLYNYHIVVTAKQYPVIAPYLYLYPKGDQNKGIEYLHIAAKHNNRYLSTEGNYFLMKLYLEEKKYPLALNHVNELLTRFPQNAIFQYYKFNILIRSGNIIEAEMTSSNLLNELKKNKQVNAIQIAHFEQLIVEDQKKFHQQKPQ